MSVFGIAHTIEDILAKPPVERIFCFSVSPIVLLITNEMSGILNFRKSLSGGSKTPNI
jgi:hypothetical protein